MLRLPLFFLLLLTLPCLAQQSYKNPDLGLTFPAEMAGMKLVRVQDYEANSPGLGIGVSYRNPSDKADIYIYSGGHDKIPEGDTEVLRRHFQQIIGDVTGMEKTGQYQDVKIIRDAEKVEIAGKLFLHSEFRFTHDKVPRISHTYLSVVNNRFFKIRCTYPSAEAEAGKKTLEDLLKGIDSLLSQNSA